jgi:methionyl aminopeptidase
MIILKSKEQIAWLRESGKILAQIMNYLTKSLQPGLQTREIDALAERLIAQSGAYPAFKGYKGYPCATCISVNEEVVHGLPGERRLKEGDLVSIDLGINYKGYFTDAALSVALGKVDGRLKKLLETTRRALALGIQQAQPGNHLSDISYAIQHYVEKEGFSVVRQFVGHGIGLQIHEEPEIPNFGHPHNGPLLKAGMVLAIEPMVNMGTWEVEVLKDGWTAVTKDRLPSCHFEQTIAIGEHGPEILTPYLSG